LNRKNNSTVDDGYCLLLSFADCCVCAVVQLDFNAKGGRRHAHEDNQDAAADNDNTNKLRQSQFDQFGLISKNQTTSHMSNILLNN
jgi:hypothetical protein